MYYPLSQMKILSGSKGNTFGMVRKHDDGSPKAHQGWDLQTLNGSPLYAIAEGEIAYVDKTDNSNYGRSIMLRFQLNGQELYAFYAHIESSLVQNFDWVSEGTLIGYSGSTGNAKGSKSYAQHLHFEIREKRYCGKGLDGRLDPVIIFGPPPYGGFCAAGPVPGY